MLKPQYYVVNDFKFESGDVISELKVEYAIFGNKQTDNKGNIINGVLYLHGWSGDYTSIKRIEDIIGPGKAIDTNKFFVICPTVLGSPGSSSPSNSSLGSKFPKYGIIDMVNAQFCLVNQLKIKHLKGIIGTSMGGFQAIQWAVNYPNFMDFIIPITTSSNVKGQNFAIFNLMNMFITEDPNYKDGKYDINPEIGPQNASMLLYIFGFSPAYYKTNLNDEIIESLNEMKLEGLKTDANDIVWRNEAAISFDVSEDLFKIKARTLIIGINQDQYFPPDIDTIPLFEGIKNSKIFLYDSLLGHLGSSEIKKAELAIKDFLDEIV
ncbi:MAG: alpha/beta fold hydrolase [Methanobacterium sp.]|uniref:alpha/beta fold hydrolase n=1 Tax=Methanobacterium sp. TaxID=2164 RepID=UPI003D64B436|nr:alpha/beta fold hydrolase [Methanobacterium sp.]